MENSLQKEFLLTPAQADSSGTCRPDTVMWLLQEAAGAHAEALGAGREVLLSRHNCVWMLVRSRYRLEQPLRAGQKVTVETWAYRSDGLTSNRDFALWCEDRQVGQANQVWVLVDMEQRAMVRMRDFAEIQTMAVAPGRAPVKLRRLSLPELHPAGECMVTAEDIDVNGHMNNACYLNYVMRPLGEGFVRELQINYDRECRLGDTLLLQSGSADGWQYVRGVNAEGLTSFEARVVLEKS